MSPAPHAPHSEAGESLARHLACIGELDGGDHAALLTLAAEIVQVKRGAELAKVGDRPANVVVVLEGMLCRYTLAPDGRRQIHSFYMATEAPSLGTLYLDRVDSNLAAVTDCRLGLIPHEQLYRLIDERPGVRKLLLRETLVQAAIFREWLMRNSNMAAHSCIAHLICEMFTRARAAGLTQGESFELRISQQMLSEAVGLTSVHTNRTLMLLRQSGAVEWRDGIVSIRDWARLKEIARFDPYYLHLRER